MRKEELDLWPHQRDIIKQSCNRYRQLVVAGTGTGKTVISLAGLKVLQQLKKVKKAFIVCDNSSICSFISDIDKYFDFKYIEVKSYEDIMMPEENYDIFLLTKNRYKMISKYIESGDNLIIFDEAHGLGDFQTDITQNIFDDINKIHKYKYIWFLTASPITKNVNDLFFLLNVLCPGLLGTYPQFLDQYCITKERKINARIWSQKQRKKIKVERTILEVLGAKNVTSLKNRIAPYTTFHFHNYNDRVKFISIPVNITESEYNDYVQAANGLDIRKEKAKKDAAEKFNYTKEEFNAYDPEVAAGVKVTDLQLVVDKTESKFKALENWMEEHEKSGGIVYFYYNKSLDFCYNRLKSMFLIKHITGKQTSIQRRKAIKWMQSGRFIFISSAGGQSLNLDKFNKMLFYNTPSNIGSFSQAAGRIIRLSSNHNEFYIYMLETKDTIDEYNTLVISHEADLIKKIIGGDPNIPDFNPISRSAIIRLRSKLLWCRGN